MFPVSGSRLFGAVPVRSRSGTAFRHSSRRVGALVAMSRSKETAGSSPLRLSEFQRDLIAAVGSLDSPSGCDIRSYLNESYGTVLRENRVYRNLRELEDSGLVDVDRSALKNVYSLTERGETAARSDQNWREI